MTARTRWLAGVAAVLVLAGGCGDDAPPAEQVPAIGTRLDAVDEAVASHDYDTARTAIAALERSVEDARRNGDLDPSRAEEILGAAETLQHALPGPAPAGTTPSQSPTPTEESEPEEPENTPAPPAPPGKEKKDKPPKPEKHEKGHGHEH